MEKEGRQGNQEGEHDMQLQDHPYLMLKFPFYCCCLRLGVAVRAEAKINLATLVCIKNGYLWFKSCPAESQLMPKSTCQQEILRWQREHRESANHATNLENTKKASTYQSCDKGHPEMPEVIVQQPTVHYVSKESNASCFTQPVSWFGFCRRRKKKANIWNRLNRNIQWLEKIILMLEMKIGEK